MSAPLTSTPPGRVLSAALLLALVACAHAEPAAAPAAAAAPAPAAAAPAEPVPPAGLRLAPGVRPTGYVVELRLDPAQPTFEGTVEVALQLDAPTSVLWLHGREVEVLRASASGGQGGPPLEARVVQGTHERLGFVLPQPLPAGPATLRVAYRAQLSARELDGAFRVEDGGAWYAFTQFEALGARRAVPSFDEPGFKVPFTLSLVVPRGLVALGNMPEAAREPVGEGHERVRFAKSPPLPTYLWAWGVGPFELLDAGPAGKNRVPVRVVAPKGRAAEGAHAGRATVGALAQLEAYFDIPFPYPKLDVLAVPLFGGAMEHPGLITFNQQLALQPPAEDTPGRQRSFTRVQVHELAHQWFGNLVTMAWWDDLWLNESFASWSEARIMEGWEPTWGDALDRVAERSAALEADSLASARRIRQPIESNDDILNAFDGITYGKGSAVLSMTEAWLGRDVFQQGIRRYLTRHAQGNATAEDFLRALGEASGRDVKGVLSTFLEQPGAPLVTFALECKAGAVPALRLKQQRYRPLGSPAPAEGTWRVPLCVRYGTGRAAAQRACTVLEGAEARLELPEARGCPSWLVPNADGAGYYRTALDAAALAQLEKAPLSPTERVWLHGDALASARAGLLPAADALALARQGLQAPERGVVEAALGTLALLDDDLVPEGLGPQRAAWVRAALGPRLKALGLTPRKGEGVDATLLRPQLLRWVGVQGEDPRVRDAAVQAAHAWVEDPAAIAPSVTDATLEVAAATGEVALHRKLVRKLPREQSRHRRRQMLQALGGFRSEPTAEKNLELVLGSDLDLRETGVLLRRAVGHPDTRARAWAAVTREADTLLARLPEDAGAGLIWMGGAFCSDEDAGRVEAFFGPRAEKLPGGKRTLAQTLETVRLCAALKQGQRESLRKALEAPAPVQQRRN